MRYLIIGQVYVTTHYYYGSAALCWGLGRFFTFLILKDTLDLGSACSKAATYTQDNTNTDMPLVGFEPTTPVSERARTVHALDRPATVMGADS
jgi:hypothetical protein